MIYKLIGRDIQVYKSPDQYNDIDMSSDLIDFLGHYDIKTAKIARGVFGLTPLDILGKVNHSRSTINTLIVQLYYDVEKIVQYLDLSLKVDDPEEEMILRLAWDGRYEES